MEQRIKTAKSVTLLLAFSDSGGEKTISWSLSKLINDRHSNCTSAYLPSSQGSKLMVVISYNHQVMRATHEYLLSVFKPGLINMKHGKPFVESLWFLL